MEGGKESDSDGQSISTHMTRDQVLRWYERSKVKLDNVLLIENWLNKILNLDVYVREMMELEIGSMTRIKRHHHKIVCIDTESSHYNTDEEDAANADDDCEHVECHRVHCKIEAEKETAKAKVELLRC